MFISSFCTYILYIKKMSLRWPTIKGTDTVKQGQNDRIMKGKGKNYIRRHGKETTFKSKT